MKGSRRLMSRGVGERLLAGLYVDLNWDIRSSVFLAGSGRSGTSWLSEVVNHRRDYRYIFEPFNPEKVNICGHFRSKQYLRPDDKREEFLVPARKILSGGLRNGWTDRFHRGFITRRRLIKDIRANLLLGWMHANFPEMPMILLLRHPCAVVASRLALGWRDNLAETMEQEDLIADHLFAMEDEIRSARDDFERHLFLWCIDNYVPLAQFSPGEVHVAFYENLLVSPEEELQSLFAFLGGRVDERVYGLMERPSPSSRGDTKRNLDGWRNSVSKSRIRRAGEILGLFGLDRIYGEDSMPDPRGALDLMRTRPEEASGWANRR